jgi:predicted RNase H-like nuclease
MGLVVAGLDGFKKRWVCIVLRNGAFHSARVFASLEAAAKGLSEATVIAVDTPIGFGTGNGRCAEHEAKEFVGARRNSVFLTLPRAVYEAETFAEAKALAKALTGKGLIKQSFELRKKMFEAEKAAAEDRRIVEVHPEVSFRELGGEVLAYSKASWAGLLLRRQLLGRGCIEIPDDLAASSANANGRSDPRRACPDDVLDAAVAAWTAHRKATGIAERLPRGDYVPSEGVIWY